MKRGSIKLKGFEKKVYTNQEVMATIEHETTRIIQSYVGIDFLTVAKEMDQELRKAFEVYPDNVEYFGFTSELSSFTDIKMSFNFKEQK